MRIAVRAIVLVAGALAASMAVLAVAQTSVPVDGAARPRLWFVELSGAPTADGNTLAAVQAEKAAFRTAAQAAGIRYVERRAYDVLFNGFSVQVDPADRVRLSQLPGVAAMYPVAEVPIPTTIEGAGSAPDLARAIEMTGAKYVQDVLGYTGAGVRVAVIDTGIDIDHPAFGGSGTPGNTAFPSARVVAGYDFVGDAYDFSADTVPVPDANPDDCNGHGTHVAGIVGGNGAGIRGVAPGVTLGAYRVFGCVGSTSDDVMIAAMEMALADGMQIINMSIGSPRQWPQYPTAQAASRLVNKGIAVVVSIGNNGPLGTPAEALFAASAPGVGGKVIGVASYDNSQPVFLVNGARYPYSRGTGAPSTDSLVAPLVRSGTAATTDDLCTPRPAGTFTGAAVLVRRGACSFFQKASNAQNAGAVAIIIYNNVAGPLGGFTVAGSPPITIPAAGVSDAQGVALDAIVAAGPATVTFTDQGATWPEGTGGLISGFSSFGLSPDLDLKPSLGAPGGGIRSAYPLELGGAATLSGTSMSSPHVAGGAALLLEAKPNTPSNGMRTRLQNTAKPKPWANNPSLGLLDHVHRQGAGMLDIAAAVQSSLNVEPSQIALGESESGPKTVTLALKNGGASALTLAVTHSPGAASLPNAVNGNVYVSSTVDAPASVALSASSIVVPANGTGTITATITAPAGLQNRGLYGGYITFTDQDGGSYRVPYAGLKGDYQTTIVLTPTPNGFPWLAKLVGTNFVKQPSGASYTMVGQDVPYFLLHFDQQPRRVRMEAFDAVSGKAWHRVSDDQYLGGNNRPNDFFWFDWNGKTFTANGRNNVRWDTVPNGRYVVTVSVLKPLGDSNNPAHWETWTTPPITIARP